MPNFQKLWKWGVGKILGNRLLRVVLEPLNTAIMPYSLTPRGLKWDKRKGGLLGLSEEV